MFADRKKAGNEPRSYSTAATLVHPSANCRTHKKIYNQLFKSLCSLITKFDYRHSPLHPTAFMWCWRRAKVFFRRPSCFVPRAPKQRNSSADWRFFVHRWNNQTQTHTPITALATLSFHPTLFHESFCGISRWNPTFLPPSIAHTIVINIKRSHAAETCISWAKTEMKTLSRLPSRLFLCNAKNTFYWFFIIFFLLLLIDAKEPRKTTSQKRKIEVCLFLRAAYFSVIRMEMQGKAKKGWKEFFFSLMNSRAILWFFLLPKPRRA